ncbi:MAG: HAMP domain-containing protein, partial [Acidimicrobiales bacterium]
MSSTAAQLRFAAEFAGFLTVVVGAAIAALRPGLLLATPRTRPVLIVGFLSLGAAAFLDGSLLFGSRSALVLGLRALGLVLLGGATLWRGARAPGGSRWWLALGAFAAGEIVTLSGPKDAGEWLHGLGALALGVVLFEVARRSISTRVAVSAVATLLVVVMAVSVALSSVISHNVQREAVTRISERALTESEVATTIVPSDALGVAQAVATVLESDASQDGRLRNVLLSLAQHPAHEATVEQVLVALRTNLFQSSGPLAYVNLDASPLAVTPDLTGSDAAALSGYRFVSVGLSRHTPTVSVQAVGHKPYAIGLAPVQVLGPDGVRRPVGAVIATTRLDATYLQRRTLADPQVGLVLADGSGVLATSTTTNGLVIPRSVVSRLTDRVLRGDVSASTTTGRLFVSARPVAVDRQAQPPLVLLAATPTTTVATTRRSLFRTLFMVALITALLGLLVALVVGERIGAGLRRLTRAAEGIQRGDLAARGAVVSEDEVGVLGAAFDSMAGSIQTMTE